MRKIVLWSAVIAFIVFIVDWGIMGVKLFDGNYDITIEAYIGLACWVVMSIGLIVKIFGAKCSTCKKILDVNAKYCLHCGREVLKELKNK